ncbi:MAG: glycine--tRNA ligase [Chloroflexota bacterium]|nr:glycine--tRNA ligase [Dehalococcoidia bacterium]MDW8253905.1 glycine--tRNA ligase [Chloroflexota bacterium]
MIPRVSTTPLDIDKFVSLCKRRGFVFQSSEIYGGLGGVWDFGPLGAELKRNYKEAWWRAVIQERDDVVGLDSAILMHPRVWEASGHVENFTDPLVDCLKCRQRFRADQLDERVCPQPPCPNQFTEARNFNLMFETTIGPIQESGYKVYLRPETAQGIFVNFENVRSAMRRKLPFGIGQYGKAFRNEITIGKSFFRVREFEQMEVEYFVKPGTDEEWHRRWIEDRLAWYYSIGIRRENLRVRAHEPNELSHYSKATSDIEYRFPDGWLSKGWGEIEGIANRTDYDLRRHSEFSGKNLTYFDEETNEHYFPYVIEPSAGVDRGVLVALVDAYDEEPDKEGVRVVLRLHPVLAPVKVAVLPLSRKEPLTDIARRIRRDLARHWTVQYDDTQAIGRRYRRQDEIGTPFCVTVDFETVNDQAVTIRDRDTMAQIRVPIAELVPTLEGLLAEKAAACAG